ncbi:MAG: alanine--tRNA ligase [Candidatus Poseidoniaceae archaeon]|jgi:alanyl-tRNA synthetase|nr:alanine--tRNA ligase [Candidatus Poseidoniaceae archaeon]
MGLPPIELEVFQENGYFRRQCKVSGLWFWTCDQSRETCGDTEQDEYTFIGEPIISGFSQRGRELKNSMRESFLSFFENNNHSRIEPYPVLARWRDDIHLTIASIADFQPHVTSGAVEPPANPLTISQPCIRLNDVDAVGRSGRHLTTFEMMAHHVFNRPDEGQMYYWMDECVRYCHELLCDTFMINPLEVTYVENPWSGGGNAGPAVEVIVGGLELATLVFMNLEEHESGDVEIKGTMYREMPLQIIDTGYGLERFCWAAAGTPTIYEAIYPETVNWLKELSGFSAEKFDLTQARLDSLLGEMSRLFGIMNIEAGSDGNRMQDLFLSKLRDRGHEISLDLFQSITEPLSRIYAIPDHMHAICNMLGDGLVPSNAKSGYLVRMMARRVLRMRDDLGLKINLSDLAKHHLEVAMDLSCMKQTNEGLITILNSEEERYIEMLRKGRQVVATAIKSIPKDAIELPDEILFTMNDSNGISPDLTVNIANDLGWNLSLRTGFNAEMAERHAAMAKLAAKTVTTTKFFENLPDVEATKPLYYDDSYQTQFEANVLACIDLIGDEIPAKAKFGIVLDETCFYPEGGGQEGDYGIIFSDKTKSAILDTRKIGEVIIHLSEKPFVLGEKIVGEIDWDRRRQLMDHHTSVHVVGGAARKLLGPHIYQAGANKSVESARLDITHYRRLTRNDLDAIEELANEVINSTTHSEKLTLNRKDADIEFGFDLYQGGAPKGNEIRILRISNHDTQACGGTHHDDLGLIGQIRLIRSNAVQDGVERIHIVAGEAALEHARMQDGLLRETAEVFQVPIDDLPSAASRFFTEWKDQRKRIEQLEAEIVRLRTSGGGNDLSEIEGIRIVVMEVDGDLKKMTNMLKELTLDSGNPTLAILGSRESGGKLMVAITENSIASEKYNAVEILNEISSHINGGGGGRPTFAQGGGSNPDGLTDSLDAAKKLIGV